MTMVMNGLFVGGTFGVLQLLRVHGELAQLPLSTQFRYLAVSWFSYGMAGVVVTGASYAAMSRWSRSQIGRENLPGWPPAVALSALIWLEMIATDTELSLGLLGAATLVAVAAFISASLLVKYVPHLRGNAVWAGVSVLALMAAIAWVLSTEPASHGFTWRDMLLSMAALFMAGTRVLPDLPRRQRRARLGSAAAIVSLFVAALVFKGVAEGRGSAKQRDGFNVLLITVDTLRADHLSSYGNPRVKTPYMDRLARQGILFETTISTIPLTNPSHTTILTGMYPGNHGVTLDQRIPLREGSVTLPEMLRDRGYRTAAFVSSTVLARRLSALHARFQLYDDDLGRLYPLPGLAGPRWRNKILGNRLTRDFVRWVGVAAPWGLRTAEQTIAASKEWLRLNAHSRFFLWIHLYDPHGSYEPPPPFDRMYDPDYSGPASGNWYGLTLEDRERFIRDPRALEHIKALYAGEVSYVDQEIGELLSVMDGLHLTEQTLIVLTSDHGESLTEHNYFFDHSVCLYDADLKVPLIFRFPDGKAAGRRVASLASLTDILPTILDSLGMRAPRGLDGHSRLGPSDTSSDSTSPTVVSALFRGEIQGDKRLMSVRSADRKYIRTSAWWADFRFIPASEELYDLASDPGETRNILTRDPEQAAHFRALAATYWDRWQATKEPGASPLSEEDKEMLRSLGYMQ